jgi:hypothetical protein
MTASGSGLTKPGGWFTGPAAPAAEAHERHMLATEISKVKIPNRADDRFMMGNSVEWSSVGQNAQYDR